MSKSHATFLLATTIAALGGCGDGDGDGGNDTSAIWDLSNNELHRIHVAAFVDGNQPALITTHNCVEGGSVEMTLTYDGAVARENLRELLHRFEDCQIDGTVISGQLDYLNFSDCADGTPSFDILGSLQMSGELETDCDLIGAEVCGKVSGTVCGDKAK